jgi:CubicO group peptidase (beta-lactamase class C family)
MKPRSLSTIALLLAVVVAAPIARSAGPAVSLPDTGPGRVAAAYFAAFNSGHDEALRAFYDANVSKEGLAQRPVEQRLAVNREMRDEHGTFTPVRIVESADDHLRVIVRTAHDRSLDLTLLFEPGPGFHLAGIRVQDSGPDRDEPEAGIAPPQGEAAALGAWRARLDSLSAAGAFSGAVLVAKGDSILLRAAYGLASRADRQPNRADTRFNLGSINKIFTKLAIGQLVERGKVRLDDTIDRYLPDYPKPVASKVTVRQLLDHRGGIGDIFGEPYDRADRSKLRRVADWIPLFRDKPLAFEPGTKTEYSNGGYALLGAIIESASGEDYYDYVRRHIYEPLGMRSTDHYASDEKVTCLASGYTRQHGDGARPDASGLSDNAFSRPLRGSPAGGGYSTLDDMLRFTRAIRAGTLLRAETRRDGFGELGPGPGGEVGFGIGGGAPGLNAAVEMNGPYTILVFANLDPPAAERAASQLRRWLTPGGSGERRIIGGPGPAGHQLIMKAGEQPGETPEHTSIPEGGVEVEMLRNGHLPAVRLMVNGQGPFLFAIDTGGMGSARLDSTLVVKLGLKPIGQARAGDPSGRNMRLMDLVHVQSIEIGGARFENMTAAVRDYNERLLGEPIDGVLGFGLFKECLFTLDYPGNRVKIELGDLPPVDGRDVIPFTAERGIPMIQLQVDSLWVDADVDAGAMGGFMLPASLASRLALASEPRVVGRARTVSNEFEIKAAELKGSVRLGGHEFPGATVGFQPLFPMANVGARVLRDFRVTFDQKNGRMRLTRGT